MRNGNPDWEFGDTHELALTKEIMGVIGRYHQHQDVDPSPLCLRDTMLAVAALLHLEAATVAGAKSGKPSVGGKSIIEEFTEAARLAPQWPEARYNLALAKESAGDYSGAMTDLKLYQQFKLSDTEARTVQDKIYAIEARQKMEISDAAANVQAKADSTRDAFIRSIQGDWKSLVSSYIISINRADDGSVVIKSISYRGGNQPVSNVSITGTVLHFVVRTQWGDQGTVLDESLSLASNGKLVGPVVQHWSQSTIDSYMQRHGRDVSNEVSNYNNSFDRQ